MKEAKIEKFVLNLSTRWDCSPQEAVDRLNHMNETEINKLVNSMTKKFKTGGFIDCLRNGGSVDKCKCGKTIKAQEGRVLGSEQYPHATRKEAINAAVDQMGFTKAQARRAYQNQKNALRKFGFRGNEMRQSARYNIIDTAYPRATEEISRIEPVEEVSRIKPLSAGPQINMPSNTLVANNTGLAPVIRSERPEVLTFSNQSFDSAFANARKMGLSEFAWQGGRYSTNLDPEEKDSYLEETNNTLAGKTTGGTSAPVASTDGIYNAGARARAWFDKRRAERKAREALLENKMAQLDANYTPISATEALMKVIPNRRS